MKIFQLLLASAATTLISLSAANAKTVVELTFTDVYSSLFGSYTADASGSVTVELDTADCCGDLIFYTALNSVSIDFDVFNFSTSTGLGHSGGVFFNIIYDMEFEPDYETYSMLYFGLGLDNAYSGQTNLEAVMNMAVGDTFSYTLSPADTIYDEFGYIEYGNSLRDRTSSLPVAPIYATVSGVVIETDVATPVPLPAALPLLGAALGGLALTRRKRRAA